MANIRERVSATLTRFDSSLPLLLVISGAFGAVLGTVSATWQAPNENAQVLMRMLPYDPASPVYAFQVTAFSLVNHVTWFFLALTNSEIASSILLSALLGMVTLQTVAMLMFFVIQNSYVAVIAALVAVRLNIFGTGISYPITILGSSHAHGRAGMIVVLLALVLFALSRTRAAFAVTALAPFVHAGWGLWLNVCLMLVFIIWFPQLRVLLTRKNLIAYGVAAGLCAALYFWQKVSYPVAVGASPPDFADGATFFQNYIRYWDSHRRPYTNPLPLFMGFILVAVSLTWALVMRRRTEHQPERRLFYSFVIVAAILSSALVFIPSWFDPSNFPTFFVAVMPGRYVNALIFIALPAMLAQAIKSLLLASRSTTNLLSTAMLAALLTAIPWYVERHVPRLREEFTRTLPLGTKTLGVLTTSQHYFLGVESRVLTITPMLDYLGYGNNAIAGPLAQRTRDIFGISLDRPPQPGLTLHRGAIASNDYELLWEERSCSDWNALAHKYRFDLIIVPQGFGLKLPLVREIRDSRIYRPACS